MRTWRIAVVVVGLAGCHRLFDLESIDDDPCSLCSEDAEACSRCTPDAGYVDDAISDASTDADTDAAVIDAKPGCTTHAACNSAVPGTCCVTPGVSTGHCEVGTVIGGGTCYVGP